MGRVGKVMKVVDPLPEQEKVAQPNYHSSPLFTRIPKLQGKLPWAPSLRELNESPVDWLKIRLPGRGKSCTVSVKREGLLSSRYGGNKVRTLEHLLPCAVAQQKYENRKGKIIVLGAPGSNQCVAMATHAPACNAQVDLLFMVEEGNSLENSLNLASSLSLPTTILDYTHSLLSAFAKVVHLVYFNKDDLVCAPGGASIPGCLGHINGILELADQIERGYAENPTHIFLALGSGCTTAGILAGIAVSRALGNEVQRERKAFSKPVHVHAAIIHHVFKWVPGIVKKNTLELASDTLKELRKLTGLDAMLEFEENVAPYLSVSGDFAGHYGSPTDEMINAKFVLETGLYEHRKIDTSLDSYALVSKHTKAREDRNTEIDACDDASKGDDEGSGEPPKPWYCTTFSGKGAALMLSFLDAVVNDNTNNVKDFCACSDANGDESKCDNENNVHASDAHVDMRSVLFWSTKSVVQPFGDGIADVCERAKSEVQPHTHEWMQNGGITDQQKLYSVLRYTKHSLK
eukprot:CFRG4373T1